MRLIGPLIIGIALTGCVSTRQERAAEFQRDLPQLVAACNGWIQVDSRLDGPTPRHDGWKACRRLAGKKSLGLADPAAANAYARTASQKAATSPIQNSGVSGTTAIPMPLPQVQ